MRQKLKYQDIKPGMVFELHSNYYGHITVQGRIGIVVKKTKNRRLFFRCLIGSGFYWVGFEEMRVI